MTNVEITDAMVAIARRAAESRAMHENGCPEREATRAALAAVAPLIRAAALEEAAKSIEEPRYYPSSFTFHDVRRATALGIRALAKAPAHD